MWRIVFLAVVLVGVLAVTLALTFGAGAWRIARLQAGVQATSPTPPPATATITAPTPGQADADANANQFGPAQRPMPGPPSPMRPRVVVDPPPPGVVPMPPPIIDPPREVIKPIIMLAKDAVIRGDDLHVDANGTKATVNWQNRFDSLEWSVIVPRTGEYIIEMEYACDPLQGGGVYKMTFSGLPRFSASIRPTNGWDDYQTVEAGHALLAGGPNDIAVWPTFLQPDHVLMNLRSIKITLVREMDEIPEGRQMRGGRGFLRRFE